MYIKYLVFHDNFVFQNLLRFLCGLTEDFVYQVQFYFSQLIFHLSNSERGALICPLLLYFDQVLFAFLRASALCNSCNIWCIWFCYCCIIFINLFFPQFYWDAIDMQHCISFKCTVYINLVFISSLYLS